MMRFKDFFDCPVWARPHGPLMIDFGDRTWNLPPHTPGLPVESAVAWVMDGTPGERNPEVRPVSLDDFLTQYAPVIRSMPEAEWQKLRSIMIGGCLEVMRDCPDAQVRAAAFDAIVTLGIVS